MELRQLRYFIAVAEELHFGRAAKRVHIAQPPLSQQIKSLEEELGVKLLERTSRKVSLTTEGEFFLDEARSIMERVNGAVNQVQAMSRGEAGRLSITFVGTAAYTSFTKAVREFREANPKVALSLREASSNSQLKEISEGCVDLGIIRYYAQDLSDYRQELFMREPYMLALPADHHLCELKTVPLAALEKEPIIMFPRCYQPELYDTMISSFNRAGFSPNIVQESATKQTTLGLVATGLGMAFVPNSLQRIQRTCVAYRPLESDFPDVKLYAVWKNTGDSALLRSFVDFILKHRTGCRQPSTPDWAL